MQADTRDDRLAKARAGDGAAFGQLLDPRLEPAYRLAVTMLGDSADAEDAVQDSCLTAWRKLRNVRPGSDLKPWFLGVVANRCRSAKRTKWWGVIRVAQLLDIPRFAPRDPETRLDLATAFDRLSHDQRRVLALFYGLDMTMSELAAALNCSEAAAKARLYRAVGALRPGLVSHEVNT